MTLVNLYEAYNQIYDDSTFDVEDILSDDDLDILEELDDQTLEEIVEGIILDLLLDEDCDVEDIEDIFEEVLCEARVDMAARARARQEYARSSEKSATEAKKRGDSVRRKEKRAETIKRVKGAVKSGVEKAKSAVKSGIKSAKEAGRSAKFHGLDKHVASYANQRKLHPAPGMAARAKDPAKRRALRSKVASDIVSRVKGAVTGRVNAAKSAAKSTAKRAVGRAAGAVASRATRVGARATRLANRMAEELDLYDVVLEHLLNKGYAETPEAAEMIMVNMSEEWREDILHEAKSDPEDEQLKMDVRGRRHVEKTQGKKGVENYDKHIFPNRGMWVGAERGRHHRARRGVKTKG